MKLPTVAAVLLQLLAAVAGADGFKPPASWRNANLVHVISLEKNHAKESINIQIENISPSPQDEYFLRFDADQAARVGGIEVKDRKDASLGPFDVQLDGTDPERYASPGLPATASEMSLPRRPSALSGTQYYKIKLPAPIKAGGQQTIGITFYYLKAYTPLPRAIAQDEQQYLSYSFSAICPSVYPTLKQKTEVKLPTTNVPDYTKLPGHGDIKEFPQKQGSKLVYGPFGEQEAGATLPATVRFEFTKPVTHVSLLERDVEVSHWGGNVAFEERYTLHHLGANLSSQFNRVKWAQTQYFNPTTYALKELRVPLSAGSVDPYYTDVIGNVSTSKFRSGKREALLELKPRYPVFGGWKYPFTIGWNSDAKNYVRKLSGDSYILNVPFLQGPRQPEGIEYEKVQVRVILPEGAR